MGRNPQGSRQIRLTATQRQLVTDHLVIGSIRNDDAYAADKEIVLQKLRRGSTIKEDENNG